MLFILRLLRLSLLVCLLLLGAVAVLTLRISEGRPSHASRILRLTQLWYRMLLKVLNVKVDRQGSYEHQPAMICANHISWLDIPVIGSQMPTYFLSKAELKSIPLLGWMAQQAGTLFIRRGAGDIDDVRDLIKDYLGRDHCLTFFPEATTGNGYALRRFHPRLFAAAIDTDTAVIPIALRYIDASQPNLRVAFGDESLAANLWRLMGRWETRVQVTVMSPIAVRGIARKPLADQAMNQIADALNLPPERRGLDLRAPLPEALPEPHRSSSQ